MATEIKTDDATMDALREISGSDTVRVHKGVDDDGKAITAEGYLLNGAEYVFRNDKGQSVHVSADRLNAHVAAAAPDAQAATPDPAAPAKGAKAAPAK